MAIRNKNLNLLPILQALLNEESVARAADRVGLSQPAMSGALARLRDLLGDPLLVRVGRQMKLTPRAQSLRRRLDEICDDIEHLFEPQEFDAAHEERDFVICVADYLAMLLSEPLLARLATEAPGVRIKFNTVPRNLPQLLKESRADVAICANWSYWPELNYQHLLCDRFVPVVSLNHPLASREKVTEHELAAYPHIAMNYADGTLSETEASVVNFASQMTMMTPFIPLFHSAHSNAVARLPMSMFNGVSDILPLKALATDSDVIVDTGLFWAKSTDNSICHAWLRETIIDCFASISSTKPACCPHAGRLLQADTAHAMSPMQLTSSFPRPAHDAKPPAHFA